MSSLTELEVESNVFVKKVFSASLFALSSLMITVVNKTVLSVYKFPSYQVLGLGQMVATLIVLYIGRYMQLLQFPSLDDSIVHRIWPLPLVYLGNMVTGLGGTKELNLPMFTILRRLSILMTMVFERIILNVQAPCSVQISVMAMVAGALIASADDITFSWIGYTLVLLNDIFSAVNGVYLKKILDSKELGMYGLLYYDSFFMIIPAAFIAWQTGDLIDSANYTGWNEPLFLTNFLMSCIMGIVLSYSTMLCTKYNSALTTAVIGSIKSIFLTYFGMVMIDDYIFSWLNFIGLSISTLASFVYTYVTFKQKSAPTYELLKNDKVDIV